MKSTVAVSVLFLCLLQFITQGDAVRCYLCQNATGNCNTGECYGGVCYKTQAYYTAAGRQQEYVQKGCATTGEKKCNSVNLFSYSNAQQCICDTDLCNGVPATRVPLSFIAVLSTVVIAWTVLV